MYAACLLLLISSVGVSNAEDTMRPNKTLKENQTLISAGGVFELGFFQDAVSGYVYVGIWFKNITNKKPVWVANRDNPLEHLYASFKIRNDGNLIATDRRQAPMLVNYGSLATSSNTTATLLDTGNLILKQGDEVIWQSFDFPTDTLLPGMRLGWFGLQTAQPRQQYLLSWLGPQNPSRGVFTVGTADAGRVAVWNRDVGHVDVGWVERGGVMKFIFKNSFSSFNLSYTSTFHENYLTFNTVEGYDVAWLVIASTGQLDEYALYKGGLSIVRHDLCDAAGAEVNASVCLRDAASLGNCRDGDAFVAVNGSVAASVLALNVSIIDDFDDCKVTCSTNCSCVAFTYGEYSGCRLYYGSRDDLGSLGGDGAFYARSIAASRKQGNFLIKWSIASKIMNIAHSMLSYKLYFVTLIKQTYGFLQYYSPNENSAKKNS